jgi:beta-glucosidase
MKDIEAAYRFPQGFLWGAATASHQVEGSNTNNNWYAWEQQAGKIINGEKSGLACDWWNGRWKEDFDRAAEAHQNAHRLSIEWSRIQPTPDRWDEDALEFYRQMLRGLRDRNMTALVTLHHFTDPLWVAEKGGWENPETPLLFEKFVRKSVEALKEYCTLWVTINEPNVYSVSGYLQGQFPPGKKDLGQTIKVMMNLTRGHARAYRAIHEIQPEARVGLAINYRSFKPAHNWQPLDHMMVQLQHELFDDFFPNMAEYGKTRIMFPRYSVPEAAGTQDFIGVNYYSRDQVSFDLLKPGNAFFRSSYLPDAELSATGFIANVPEGFFESLRWANRYDKPIIVTENGVEDTQDTMRRHYLLQHLKEVWRGANFNWPIKGYFHWSLIDNFEWERGWTQRFGLWELDVPTQTRKKRMSVDLYADICRENAITTGIVRQYSPEIFEKIFPG